MDQNIQMLLELLPIPGSPGMEKRVSDFIRDKLLDMGVPESSILYDEAHKQSEYEGETGNMIVQFKGHGKGEHRMLCTHLDTVPLAVGSQPRVEGDRVVNDNPQTALGADARAGCALLLSAAEALVGLKGSHPPRTLVFFVQEEVGLVGARGLDTTLLGQPLPAMCFNFDGSDMNEVVNRVTGTERLNISITGIPAHTQNPAKGISAIVIAAEALALLENEGWNGSIQQPEGKGTANLGIIRGGKGSNVVMPELYALAEARSFELEFLKAIVRKWKDTFKAAVEAANNRAAGVEGKASVEFSPGPFYAPYFLPEDAPVIQTTLSAMKKVGLEPRIVDDAGGQDSSHVVAKGIPAAGLSFGGFSAHAVTEYVDIPQFLKGCTLARELAIG